jgi:hypothetical protein
MMLKNIVFSCGGSRYEVLKKEGALRIVRRPPPDSLTVGLWERLGALISD